MSKRGALRLTLAFTVALTLCACGGLTSVDSGPSLTDAARKVERSYRVLAVEDNPSLTIVTFDDPANPQRIETPLPSMGYHAYDAEWSFDGNTSRAPVV